MTSLDPTQHQNFSNTVISSATFSAPNVSRANQVMTHFLPQESQQNAFILPPTTHTHGSASPNPLFLFHFQSGGFLS